MQAIKFNLSGTTAFFKKPDINEKLYLTYNNIHKVACLGLLGAIIGLDGHKALTKTVKKSKTVKNSEMSLFDTLDTKNVNNDAFPEFYTKLKDIQISIIPKSKGGYFTKKIQGFNNSVGYANTDGVLQVREQWLENVNWDIYLMQGGVDPVIWDKLVNSLQAQKCVYIPYLGKNDHPAIISNVKLLDATQTANYTHINSIFPGSISDAKRSGFGMENDFINVETAPCGLNSQYGFYEYNKMVFTNYSVKEGKNNIFQCDNLFLSFS